MANLIQIRRDTAENWTGANPTLAQGELGVETDTLKMKIGDAVTAWVDLPYGFFYTWQGTWSDATDYNPRDTVYNDGNSYICLVANGVSTSVVEPSITAGWETYWDMFVAKGDTGTSGIVSWVCTEYETVVHDGEQVYYA